MTDRHEAGTRTRRAVLGDSHEDRVEVAKIELDEPCRDMITEGAWDTVRARSTISRRERSMLTIALLAASGNCEEIPMHVCAAAHWRGRK
ncbi:MAG: hypothetical protein F4103_01510 [Boseongicola sp. SB0673_bin_14]|nr:hypothetical protein [Boseongicola sp. SB0667_bin_21]MYI67478.1 hypothetical protein [Boseongicola sp. SB0673_bin_14]